MKLKFLESIHSHLPLSSLLYDNKAQAPHQVFRREVAPLDYVSPSVGPLVGPLVGPFVGPSVGWSVPTMKFCKEKEEEIS